MGAQQPKNQKLSIYLIKEQYQEFDEVIKADIDNYAVNVGGKTIGQLYIKCSPAMRPAWITFFGDGVTGLPVDSLTNKSVSAVLLFKNHGRIFAFTFGYGRSLLNPGTWEERFGLKVVLNTIDSDKIRIVDRKTLDTMLTQTRVQTSRECALDEFNLDVRQMFLKAVVGEPVDANLASKVAGADILNITSAILLENLEEKCDQIYEAYLSDRYKADFPFVENVAEVTNKAKKQELNGVLIDRINAGQFENIFLAIPEIVDWTAVDGFRFKETAKENFPDIFLKDFLTTVRSPRNISLNILKQRRVYQVRTSGSFVEQKWTVFHCLNAELILENKVYLLTEGKWYEIDTSFVAEIDREISQVKITSLPLAAKDDEKENEYNKRFCESNPDEYALMDGKNIQHGGGRSKIEFCDVYTLDKKLIHVKRYSGSSALSHLFYQGMNSAKLMMADSDFRRKVNEKLPEALKETHKLPRDGQLRDPDFEVVFGVISTTADDLPAKLPFFSKISLATAVKEIRTMVGYKVSFAGIPIQET